MPATTQELVTLMFGQVLAPQTRQPLDLKQADIVLEFQNAHLHGKRVTIEAFNVQVRAGEVIGLAGLDGSGQEMVLRACAGLWRLADGHIKLAGQDVTGQSYRQFLSKGVAFGAAGRLEEGLVGGLTLTEHIALTTETQTMIDWKRARQVCGNQLKLYNVRGRPDSQIETLSGGNQQRVLMALMPEKPILMALEQPTRGLDVDSSRWIWQQLFTRRDKGAAIIFSSPDLDELVAYSDRILVFYAGRLFEIANAARTTIDELGRLIGGHFEEYQSASTTPG
jgi:simple sugar transport system ATP-binding protein